MQIEIKADMLSLRYPMEVNLVGDGAMQMNNMAELITVAKRRRCRAIV